MFQTVGKPGRFDRHGVALWRGLDLDLGPPCLHVMPHGRGKLRVPLRVDIVPDLPHAGGEGITKFSLEHDAGAGQVERAAVHAQLERSDTDPIVAIAGFKRQGPDYFFGARDRAVGAESNGDGHSYGQASLGHEFLIRAIAFHVGAAVTDAGDPDLGVAMQQRHERIMILFLRHAAAREKFLHERIAIIHHAGRLAIGPEVDLSSRNGLGFLGDVRGDQGGGIQNLPGPVRILPGKDRGIRRRCGVEIGAIGDAPLANPGHINPRQLNPRSRAAFAYPLTNPILDLAKGMKLPEGLEGFSPRRARGMHVRLDQTRNHGAPPGIEGAGLWPHPLANLGVRANRGKNTILDRNGGRAAKIGVHGEHVAVHHNDVRRGVRASHDECGKSQT